MDEKTSKEKKNRIVNEIIKELFLGLVELISKKNEKILRKRYE